MKLRYSEVLNVYKEMEDLMSEQRKSYRFQFAIEAMKQQCQAYKVEFKWLHENYMLTLDEYLSVALVTSCYQLLTIFEQERGHVPSAVECYMKQCGASKQEAYDELYKQIENAWKDINEGFLKPRQVPMSALNHILNLTRVLYLFYKDHDGYTNVDDSIKASITTLLIDPISV
ncbi:hypothetical protein CXB51_029112 [Gossypium anomalum]|uniref:Terpene synthase metal-binding domain-containing protein n=1 Tax=Gossypium anomalum TaxID=47600 RepID=A0A8J5Y1F0_9ROSI|nr:hypothetical protein CXB51_029112 [Gossypium anomalum]